MPFGTSLPALLPTSSAAFELFVSPTGSNSNSGTSVGSPYQTILKAWQHASIAPGTVIYLRGDTGIDFGSRGGASVKDASDVTVNVKYGSSSDPVTMMTYPGDPPAVINGTRFQFNPGDLKRNDYNGGDGANLRVTGLEFKNTVGTGSGGQEGIKMNNPRNVEISECVFHDTAASGVLIRGMGRSQRLSGAITTSSTTLTLDGITNLQNALPFHIGMSNTNGAIGAYDESVETIRVDSLVSGLTYNVTRGMFGSGAQSHVDGSGVCGMWQADNVQIFNNIFYNAGGERCKANGAQTITASTTLNVDDTSNFQSSGQLAVDGATASQFLTYNSKTGTSFNITAVNGSGTVNVPANGVVVDIWAASHSHGIYYGSDAGSTTGAIYNNVFYDNASFGITLHENAEGCIVTNNTFDGAGRGGIDIAGERTHGTKDCIIKNNIVTGSLQRAPSSGPTQSGYAFNVWYESTHDGDAFGQDWADYATANNVVDLNMHYNNANSINSGYHTDDTNFWPSGTVVFTNDQHVDPAFVDAAARDYTPTATEARDAGDDAYTPPTDINGDARVTADLGAILMPSSGSVFEKTGLSIS